MRIDLPAARLLVLGAVLLLASSHVDAKYHANGTPYNVTYDHRSIIINGERELLISGSIHYPRSTPSMWPGILKQTKDAGINMVQIYTFWNLHEPKRGEYYFEDNADVELFIQLCQKYELYVNFRVGPYVCAEWNLGGFPVWLKEIPGMVFRDYNQPFMTEMTIWTTYIVDKLRPYLAANGGPIVLAQIENEYGNVEPDFGPTGKLYASWAADFAHTLEIGIPWIMCKQDDQPSVINTCNGFYCDTWIPGHFSRFQDQPAMFTENWPGWFQAWGEAAPQRAVQDVLFSMARWFAAGGTHHNYYMWHGGTTFGRWTGGPFLVTSYDYDVALNEYGYPHNPKYERSVAFHETIMKYKDALLNNDVPTLVSLGPNQDARVYGTDWNTAFTFLSNWATNNVTLTWNKQTYSLNAWSVIFLDAGKIVFDTSYLPPNGTYDNVITRSGYMQPIQAQPVKISGFWSERAGVWGQGLTTTYPPEQISTTHDLSDYLWYTQKVNIPTGGADVTIKNVNDMVDLFVDGNFVGNSRGGSSVTFKVPAALGGSRELQILTSTVGLVNYGAYIERYTRGIEGSVSVGATNVTQGTWVSMPGLKGESLGVFTPANQSAVPWNSTYSGGVNKPITWFKAYVDLPQAQTPKGVVPPPFALDMMGLNKGQVWVNGHMLGRYWLITAYGSCTPCNYAGAYDPGYCRTGCGQPSQRYYHVPGDWLTPTNNLVVIFEEIGGDPTNVNLVELQM